MQTLTLSDEKKKQLDDIMVKLFSQNAPQEDVDMIVNDFKSKFSEAEKPTISTGFSRIGEEYQKTKEVSPLAAIARLPLRATAQASRDIFGIAMKPIAFATEKIAEKISDIPAVQKFSETPFVERIGRGGADIARRISEGIEGLDTKVYEGASQDVKDTMELLLLAVGAKPAQTAFQTAKPLVEQGIGFAQKQATQFVEKKLASRAAEIEQDFLSDTTALREYEIMKKRAKANGIQTAPFTLMAEKGVAPEIKGGKRQTSVPQEKLWSDVNTYEALLERVLYEVAPTAKVSIDNAEVEILRKIARSKRIESTGSIKEAEIFAKNELQKYRSQYAEQFLEGLPAYKANLIKQGQQDASRFNIKEPKPEWKYDTHKIIASTFRQKIEWAVGSDFRIGEMNRYIQEHLNAIQLLEKVKNKPVKYGRLGKITAMAVAATQPKTVLGKIGAATFAGALVDILQSFYFSSPFKSWIIGRFAQKEPKILKEVASFLQTQAQRKGQQLFLPSASSFREQPSVMTVIPVSTNQKTYTGYANIVPEQMFSKSPVNINPEDYLQNPSILSRTTEMATAPSVANIKGSVTQKSKPRTPAQFRFAELKKDPTFEKAQEQTFEELRLKSLFHTVVKQLKEGTYPRANAVREIELYDVIIDRIKQRMQELKSTPFFSDINPDEIDF